MAAMIPRPAPRHRRRLGHTIIELIAAMVASSFLLAGLGAVMMIGRQVAYTPSAAEHRTEAAQVVNQLADELRYATHILQHTPRVLEFVIADRNADGTAERIRYEWSGTPGTPLHRTQNAQAPVAVLDSVTACSFEYHTRSQTTQLSTTVDSAETLLLSNTAVQSGVEREIRSNSHLAQYIDPASFASRPANALSWNATRLRFYGEGAGSDSDVLYVELRPAGNTIEGPTSHVLSRVSKPKSSLTASDGWNDVQFPQTVRGLSLVRPYTIVWSNGTSSPAARVLVNFAPTSPMGVYESTDSPLAGASWRYAQSGANYAQVFGQLYGTYTTPGATYDVVRNYASHVRVLLQASQQSHGRIDAAIPLAQTPEVLNAYWRCEFDRDPTTTDMNGDAAADWGVAAGGSFDLTALVNGVWYANRVLTTNPAHDFDATTVVEVRCRNTTTGGNGAVLRINADRQGGLYAPLLVYVTRKANGSQTVSLLGKPSDSVTTTLFTREGLSSEFLRFRLTISPENDVVNLLVNDEDQGSFIYPTYAPSTTNDRFLTLYADTSLAEFDYVDVRVAEN